MKMRNLKILILLLSLISACGKRNIPVAPTKPETFCEVLLRTESVSCESLIGHEEGEDPDTKEMYGAFARGRTRMSKVWPNASKVKMGDILFYRPKRYYFPEKPYPLMNLLPDGQGEYFIGAFTSPVGPVFISYAYENAIEHETAHAIGRILFPLELRKSNDDSGNAQQYGDSPYLWQILCHGTNDDPIGLPGKRDSCDKSRSPYLAP